MEKINDPHPPKGLSRLVFRLPIWLYRLHLGWILGNRFLLLTHTGRSSGVERHTVLEVVKHDPSQHTYYIASGYGEKSDWYLNVIRNCQVVIQVGRRRYQAVAERLPEAAAEDIVLDYARRHSATLRELARFMGYRIDGTEADYRALGRVLPIIEISYKSGGLNHR